MLTGDHRPTHGGLPGGRARVVRGAGGSRRAVLLTAVFCLLLGAPSATLAAPALGGEAISTHLPYAGSRLVRSERGSRPARHRRCGKADGTRVFAFNLRCRRAMAIWRGPLPRGWTGANADIAGGVAVLCPDAAFRTVQSAVTKRGTINRSRLGPRTPAVWARVPYGE